MTIPGAAVSRWHWRNWPVLVKLVAVLLVPTLVALVVGALRIVDQASAVPGYLRISQIADVQQQLSELISVLQRERHLAAAFVATGRSGARAPLELQFGAVQTHSEAVRAAAEPVDDLESTGYRFVLEELRALRPLRQSVLTGTGPVESVVTEYSALVDPLLALDSALVRKLDDVVDDAAAVHALMVSREQVSRQHTIVSAALFANRISADQLDQVRAAAVRLEAEQEVFAAALEPEQRGSYVPKAIGEAELSRQRMVQLVLDRGAQNRSLDISPADWHGRNSAAMEDLTTVEDELRQGIERAVLAQGDDARSAAGWNAVILIFALILSAVVAVLIARSMLGPLGVLRRTALDVASRRLPAAMARVRDGAPLDQTIEPVAVRTQEEIGQVARAFDEVHRQAVRLAGEQARLRAHINDIFVNLSRRSQSLVERQLQLIDRLESTEQDPEVLHNLFQLDHLATRMRRNSDNLLVLAGTEAAKRSSRPVRLVDVLRAAVSEVEQYQRVSLQQAPSMLLLGRTAGDLVHLLAELLDNATQFSPPETQVTVSVDVGADGEVMIEIMDRGVGMTESELAEVNERLGGTPVVDASVSRRMGLFVVGRLAVRHGIAVRLRNGADGVGVCASVRLPARLVRPISADDPRDGASAADASPAAGGSKPDPAEPIADKATEVGTALTAGGPRNGQGESLTNGHGRWPADASERSSSPLPRRSGDTSLRPTGARSAAARQPRAASNPPVAGSSPGASGDLFQPTPPAGVPGPATAGDEVPLQDSTPIFDDVATAWFQEHQAVPPVRWATADSSITSSADSSITSSADSSTQSVGDQLPIGRQAGSATAVPRLGPAGEIAHPAAVDAKVSSTAAVHTVPAAQDGDWGAGDEGWRAARALASPASGAGITAAGLPRRKPRALLVPGAAGGEAPVQPSGAPVRNAELIRGRLASYQQGLREGRHVRHNHDQRMSDDRQTSGSHPQQDAEEETQ